MLTAQEKQDILLQAYWMFEKAVFQKHYRDIDASKEWCVAVSAWTLYQEYLLDPNDDTLQALNQAREGIPICRDLPASVMEDKGCDIGIEVFSEDVMAGNNCENFKVYLNGGNQN